VIKAVGFDLDGTLFDHNSAASAGLSTLLEECGRPYKGKKNLGHEWTRIERVYFQEYVSGNLTIDQQRRLRMGDFLDSMNVQMPDADIDSLIARYLTHYANSWIAYPDVLPCLTALRDLGLPLAVLTNGHQSQQEAKLRRMGIFDMFESVLAIGTLTAPKPHAQAFMELSSVLEFSPKEVAYVGDDPHLDAIAASDSDLFGIWLNRENQVRPFEVKAEIQSLAALESFISQ
jgi:putative hydrolase of the HAD superfamily